MKYITRVTCRDCTYEDDQGCFGGEPDDTTHDDLASAIRDGEKATSNTSVWEYKIFYEDGFTEVPVDEINPVFERLYGYKYA